jgi:hypothetical protein
MWKSSFDRMQSCRGQHHIADAVGPNEKDVPDLG